MFTTFGVWNRSQFASTGDFGTWEGRSFCTNCGSRLFALTDREAEVKLGTLDDAPTGLAPRYELWIGRREPWLVPVDGASQHIGDRHR